MCMYSGRSISKAKKKSLRSHEMNRAYFFASEIVIFKSNLFSMRKSAGDSGSSG